jgi:T4-like virus Myoviridae tail sheath stabiliser
MLGYTYYWGTLKKYVTAFGTLVNEVTIQRSDLNGTVQKSVPVPLMYGPRERYLDRLKQNPDEFREINQILPRMSFAITTLQYDPDRKTNTMVRNKNLLDPGDYAAQWNPVPYNIGITLSILARNYDDTTQIIEQILPFFKPEWTVPLNLIPTMGIERDIAVVLTGVSIDDSYEGDLQVSRSMIISTLSFVMKGWLFGPVTTVPVIKEANVGIYVPSTNTAQEGVGLTPIAVNVTTVPGLTANGQPTSNAASSVAANTISSDSDYGFIVTFVRDVG